MLKRGRRCFVRTARHPAVVDLANEGIHLEPLDLLYDQADDLDTVYAAIADTVPGGTLDIHLIRGLEGLDVRLPLAETRLEEQAQTASAGRAPADLHLV